MELLKFSVRKMKCPGASHHLLRKLKLPKGITIPEGTYLKLCYFTFLIT